MGNKNKFNFTLLKIFITIFLFLAEGTVFAGPAVDIIPQKGELYVGKLNETYLHFTLDVSEGGYIYGNPKGPGTGKPLEIYIEADHSTIGQVLVSRPEKYAPKSGEWVFRYVKGAELYIPVKISDDYQGGKITLGIRAVYLYCTDNSCVPGEVRKEFQVNIDSSIVLTADIPQDLQPIMTENEKIEIASDNESPLQESSEFSPVFYNGVNVTGIVKAVLFGFLAGIILNFMPCVLPVISIKLSSLTMIGDNRKKAALSGLFYTAGVLVTFSILAAFAALAGKNWGFLFQSAGFIFIAAAVIFAMSLSMLGVFTFDVPVFAGKLSGFKINNMFISSFMFGLIATFLATPCSGPLLGSVLAWSLTQKAVYVFAVFISIGMGMSLPYLVVSFNPKIVSLMPRSGSWMFFLEKGMGFVMAGSALYFVMMLPEDMIKASLWAFLFISVGLFQFGKFGTKANSSRKQLVSFLVLVFFLLVGLQSPRVFEYFKSENIQVEKAPFSYERLFREVSNGRTVAVQFTADWCPNCKVVEKVSLYSDDVMKEFQKRNVLLLVADITEKGTEGEDLLNKLGSNSIPFLAIFSRFDTQRPICFRDIYKGSDVIAVLEKIYDSASRFRKNEKPLIGGPGVEFK